MDPLPDMPDCSTGLIIEEFFIYEGFIESNWITLKAKSISAFLSWHWVILYFFDPCELSLASDKKIMPITGAWLIGPGHARVSEHYIINLLHAEYLVRIYRC